MVRVTDTLGRPIAGALVAAIYPSFNGPVTSTDVDGETTVVTSWLLREEWISISAIGFQRCWMRFPTTWPQNVQLAVGHDWQIQMQPIPVHQHHGLLDSDGKLIDDGFRIMQPGHQEQGPRPPLK